jgi:hypothetical protein
MGRNNKALRNTYDRVENYLYPKDNPYNQVAYQKMSQGGTDVSGNVWLNDGSDCGRLPTLWNGSGTILQEAPGISWVV